LARHLWLHAPRVAVDFFLAILTLIGVKAVGAEFKGEIKDFYIYVYDIIWVLMVEWYKRWNRINI